MLCTHHAIVFGLILVVISLIVYSWVIATPRVVYSQPDSRDTSTIAVINQSIIVKSDGRHLTGQIKNIANQSVSNVKIVASFYDQNNKFLGSEFTFSEPPSIQPTRLGNFDLDLSSGTTEFNLAKLYTITIAWQNRDGTSSYYVTKSQTKKVPQHSEETTPDPFAAETGKTIQSKEPSSQKPLKMKYIGTIGSQGSSKSKFLHPASIEYAPSNNRVYVSDLDNNRIQIFDTKGRFVSSWGSEGKGAGQFNNPGDIAIDLSNYMYVSDIQNNRILKFDTNGAFVTQWGSKGKEDTQFNHPGDIAIDTRENFLYITDVHNNRVQKFDNKGNFIKKWGTAGAGEGQFNNPTGITIDPSGMVYVADTGNDRIQKFDGDGRLIKKWGSSGNGKMQFASPDGVTFDGASNLIYVSDRNNGRISVFSEDGNPFYQLDLAASTNSLKIKPRDVAIDNVGKLFVVDKINSKIHVFTTRTSG